jgi:hypothetical protein
MENLKNYIKSFRNRPNYRTGRDDDLPEVALKSTLVNSPVPEKKEWQGKELIIVSALALGAIGTGIWLGNRFIKKKIANSEENKSFEDGTPATLAKQIKMAFENDGWWGTDTEKLRASLRSVNSKSQWEEIIKSYKRLYNENLLQEMSSELQASEYNEMLQIIASKPDKKGQPVKINIFLAWAKRLKAAFDKTYGFLPGTDEAAILSVLNEIPTQRAFAFTGVSFQKQYGQNIIEALKSEAEGNQYTNWMTIILRKPKK